VRAALELAIALDDLNAEATDTRLVAISVLGSSLEPQVRNRLATLAGQGKDPTVVVAARQALSEIELRLRLNAGAETLFFGLSLGSVLALTYSRIAILVFAILVFFGLLLILKRTTLGLQVRALSRNRAMARAMGVRSARVDALAFGLGAGTAGLAGVALSQLTNVGPNMGQAYIIDSFMVVVFGGIGNLWGTFIGGLTLGVANKFMEPWVGTVLAKILVLVFIILFIQRRPQGLFPQRGRTLET